jgi:hypothetical protein
MSSHPASHFSTTLAHSDVESNRAGIIILEIGQSAGPSTLQLKANGGPTRARERRNAVRITRAHVRDTIIRLHARRIGVASGLRRHTTQEGEIDRSACPGEGRGGEFGLSGEEEDQGTGLAGI